MIYKTRTIEKKVPVRQAVPSAFTEPLNLPPWPEGTLRNRHLDQRIEQCEAVLAQCNADRRAVRERTVLPEEDLDGD